MEDRQIDQLDELELLRRRSDSFEDPFGVDSTYRETQSLTTGQPVSQSRFRVPGFLYRLLPLQAKRLLLRGRRKSSPSQYTGKTFLSGARWPKVRSFVKVFLCALLGLIIFTGIFRPSYTHLPPHYKELKLRAMHSTEDGRANPHKEKVFISVSLYDKKGHLASGTWGHAVLELIDLIGADNAFLSIYENDSGEEGAAALREFEKKLKCPHEIVNDAHVSKDDFPKITLPNGEERLKRLTYLSEMRNRPLRPLDKTSKVVYDKVLFLNDVDFYPVDAAQLLFSTNQAPNGRTQYLAACSLDYINPFRFYDLYATRDADGYSMGVPFFPIFSNAGEGTSRKDMLAQKDAVRVKSCWNGMVAMQAKYLQATSKKVPKNFQKIGAHNINPAKPQLVSAPVRFRAEPEIFFDACECCLLFADVLQLARKASAETSIFVNPYVRVAYDPLTLSWLAFTRRFERLFSWPHRIVNALAGMPTFNLHREVVEGAEFKEEVWVPDLGVSANGTWQVKTRTARNGMFCGVREMQVLLEETRKADKNWENTPIPAGRQLF